MSRMKSIVEKEKPPKIVSVGDAVSLNLHAHKITPQLSITDNRCMRKKIEPTVLAAEKVVHVENPSGTITEEATTAIREALEGAKHVHVVVDGEEDLLTLIAVLYAPERSLVVYGQPNEGIVIVKVTPEKKAEVAEILKVMELFEKLNKKKTV
jgi:uncharacterized protein (UPF0218 family)